MSITVFLFPQNAYRVKCLFFFLPQSLENPSSFSGAFIHTPTAQCGLGASLHDRHPRSHSVGCGTPAPVRDGSEVPEGTEPQSVCSLLPIPLSHSLARTCPSPPPPKPLSLHLSPLLPPVRCEPSGWVMSKHRHSSASTARLAASLQSQRAATLLGGACGRGRLWGL